MKRRVVWALFSALAFASPALAQGPMGGMGGGMGGMGGGPPGGGGGDGGGKSGPPASDVSTSTGHDGEMVVAGHLTLAKDLTDAAKGIHELYIRFYEPGGTARMPLGFVKFSVPKDAEGRFFDFKIYESQIVRPKVTGIPKTFDLGAKLNQGGLGDMDIGGDLTGLAKNVRFGEGNAEVTIDQKH